MLLEEVEVRAPCDPSARAWSSSIILTAGDLALLLEGLDFKHLCLFGSQALRTGKSPVWPPQGQPPLLFTFPAWYFFFFSSVFSHSIIPFWDMDIGANTRKKLGHRESLGQQDRRGTGPRGSGWRVRGARQGLLEAHSLWVHAAENGC